jgi:hypothetical protein
MIYFVLRKPCMSDLTFLPFRCLSILARARCLLFHGADGITRPARPKQVFIAQAWVEVMFLLEKPPGLVVENSMCWYSLA